MTGRLAGAATVAGVVLLAAGITAGSAFLPGQRASGSTSQALPASPSSATVVCPGPETLKVPDGGRAVDPHAPVVLNALLSPADGTQGGAAELVMHGSRSPAAADDARSLPPDPVTISRARRLRLHTDGPGPVVRALATTALGPAVLTAEPADVVPALAAVQSTLARSGDLRGLSTVSCAAAIPDTWLVGGGTVAGERLRLLLANPAPSPAVVDVDVRGPDGRVKAPSGDGVVVPAEGEVPIYIDALAPGLERVAVHVTARSGQVLATMHDSLLRGLTAGGVDAVQAAAPAAKHQVIPAVSLVNGYSKTAGDPSAAGSTSIRVAVPGSAAAVARIRLLNSSGEVELSPAAVVTVPAGGVADIPVSGIPSGTYAAVVDADVPVVAGARVGRPSEFAWAPASRPLGGSGYAVLPPSTRSTLSLVAAGASGRLVVNEVHGDGSLGDPADVDLPGGSSATVQLSPDAVAVKLSGFAGGPVAGSIVAVAVDPHGTLISVLPVAQEALAAPPTRAIEDPRLGQSSRP